MANSRYKSQELFQIWLRLNQFLILIILLINRFPPDFHPSNPLMFVPGSNLPEKYIFYPNITSDETDELFYYPIDEQTTMFIKKVKMIKLFNKGINQ